jgi:hypothetical protein
VGLTGVMTVKKKGFQEEGWLTDQFAKTINANESK